MANTNVILFLGRRNTYIETLDIRAFARPYTKYGREYENAIGKVYELYPEGRGDSERLLGIVKNIIPELPPEQDMIPLTITEEEVDAARGVIVLKAAIDYTRSWKEPLDFLGLNGKTVTLELYLSSVHPTIPNAF